MNLPAEALETRRRILDDGVILCVRMVEGDRVIEACHAAVAGGLRIFEITLTTPDALDVMARLASHEDLVVGAGTVLSAEQVHAVAGAGARFLLSPVFDPAVVDAAHRAGLLAVPGAATPREILAAHRHGASLVKVFPAGALGGPSLLRALRGPLPDVALVPTSGPTSETMSEYVAAGAVAVGVGAEVFPPGLEPGAIKRAAERVRAAMDRARYASSA
jgi:2-dehydro-3-deoxyphosphogluconate aldolase/(4S)-4-hydroxy-2-oxoglutarate aldolase